MHLRQGETLAELAVEFGGGEATAWRYVADTVRLLAARAPKLAMALRAAKRAGHEFVVIDGTLIAIAAGSSRRRLTRRRAGDCASAASSASGRP